MTEFPAYLTYLDGRYWSSVYASSVDHAIQLVQDQIKNLHPLNMSDEGAIEYRKRFENSVVTAKLRNY